MMGEVKRERETARYCFCREDFYWNRRFGGVQENW